MRTARHCPVRPVFWHQIIAGRASTPLTMMMMRCGYAFATHSDDHGHFQPAGQAGSGTSAACQRDETDAATTHHTGSQSADISPRCSAASPGRRGRLDLATGTTPNFARRCGHATHGRCSATTHRRCCPRFSTRDRVFTGNLDSLNIHETAASAGAPNLFGWNPRGIYPSTNAATQCRHALRCFPTSCNNQSGWKNVAGSAP